MFVYKICVVIAIECVYFKFHKLLSWFGGGISFANFIMANVMANGQWPWVSFSHFCHGRNEHDEGSKFLHPNVWPSDLWVILQGYLYMYIAFI